MNLRFNKKKTGQEVSRAKRRALLAPDALMCGTVVNRVYMCIST